jgi:hypothetical protein
MKLYHGTNVEFGVVDLERCPPNRDFGQGFYCTNIRKHAQERAEDKVDDEGGNINILEYEFDFDEIIKINPKLKVKRFDTICAEWAQFVMSNRLRKEGESQHEYDIVEGPVANDKMFRQFQLYANNRIKLSEFVRKIKFREATHQIAFCTEESLDALLDYNEPPRYKIENAIAELSVKLMQDLDIQKIEAMTIVYNSDIFTQLADEKTGLYLKSWQKIYELLKAEIDSKKP